MKVLQQVKHGFNLRPLHLEDEAYNEFADNNTERLNLKTFHRSSTPSNLLHHVGHRGNSNAGTVSAVLARQIIHKLKAELRTNGYYSPNPGKDNFHHSSRGRGDRGSNQAFKISYRIRNHTHHQSPRGRIDRT